MQQIDQLFTRFKMNFDMLEGYSTNETKIKFTRPHLDKVYLLSCIRIYDQLDL